MTASIPARPAGWRKYLPILSWLPAYPPSWLRRDVVAGLTAAAVVIPQAMAYAALAGLPVEVGLYASLTPMVVYALLGTSRVLSVSVTSTISLLTDRELQILELLQKRLSNKEIASQLVISPGTVKGHTIKIYQKLDVNSRRQAVKKAISLGLLISA